MAYKVYKISIPADIADRCEDAIALGHGYAGPETKAEFLQNYLADYLATRVDQIEFKTRDDGRRSDWNAIAVAEEAAAVAEKTKLDGIKGG
jgi:hypothetical protein